ncbi:MAG TPA: hypothetical protein H9913_12595 [Candidatus Blautia stercoripullorum]|uniref:Uncharacterized protein n=1 Tax=Candidatus Blautia stercoripullorum TaxID=2838502 RepID=A0A9D2U6B5_9FIRM|nr:hypothetical protein [Candidatus Blautia stercoripullorum]
MKETAPEREFLKQFEEKVKKQAEEKQEREDVYVRLARQSIETYVRTGEKMAFPEELPEELDRLV